MTVTASCCPRVLTIHESVKPKTSVQLAQQRSWRRKCKRRRAVARRRRFLSTSHSLFVGDTVRVLLCAVGCWDSVFIARLAALCVLPWVLLHSLLVFALDHGTRAWLRFVSACPAFHTEVCAAFREISFHSCDAWANAACLCLVSTALLVTFVQSGILYLRLFVDMLYDVVVFTWRLGVSTLTGMFVLVDRS